MSAFTKETRNRNRTKKGYIKGILMNGDEDLIIQCVTLGHDGMGKESKSEREGKH